MFHISSLIYHSVSLFFIHSLLEENKQSSVETNNCLKVSNSVDITNVKIGGHAKEFFSFSTNPSNFHVKTNVTVLFQSGTIL